MSRWWKKFKVKQKKTTPDFNERRRVFREATRKGELKKIQKDLKEITGKKEKMGEDTMLNIDKALIIEKPYLLQRGEFLKKTKKVTDRTAAHLKTYEDVYKKK